MTAKTAKPSTPTSGRGRKVVTKPVAKHRSVALPAEKIVGKIAKNREKYRDTSAIPVAELEEAIDPDKPLTEKAKLFVKYWAQGESVYSAAARAGYGDGATYAYRLIHYPQAKALYAQEKALYEQAAQMTRKKVMDMLVESYDMAKMTAEPSSMVAAAREIGKMCGYYEPQKIKIEHTLTDGVTQRMDRLTDEELLEVIRNGGQLPGAAPAATQPQLEN